jgi:hypothetical protein
MDMNICQSVQPSMIFVEGARRLTLCGAPRGTNVVKLFTDFLNKLEC